ncbi:hypothetical protein E2C01_069638 [Portunus trituberculatus]|uniref:Selenoprotein S n=1 Tax=Portunus trituberculatus TaxID=210409 RepID=A0A5B7I3C3_PORTR|nr:hypothetical protein [Portunus trituberculatus]
MAGLDLLIISLYMYIVGRAFAEAGQEVREETEEARERWKKAEMDVAKQAEIYRNKRLMEKILEKERGFEIAGTLHGGISAPLTPGEASGEDSDRTPAEKGNAGSLTSKVSSVFAFFKSKRD